MVHTSDIDELGGRHHAQYPLGDANPAQVGVWHKHHALRGSSNLADEPQRPIAREASRVDHGEARYLVRERLCCLQILDDDERRRANEAELQVGLPNAYEHWALQQAEHYYLFAAYDCFKRAREADARRTAHAECDQGFVGHSSARQYLADVIARLRVREVCLGESPWAGVDYALSQVFGGEDERL
jgi:hypothetical protein